MSLLGKEEGREEDEFFLAFSEISRELFSDSLLSAFPVLKSVLTVVVEGDILVFL